MINKNFKKKIKIYNDILNDLFGETHYLSTQIRIILTISIIISLCINNSKINLIFKYFYFLLITTIIGQIITDYNKTNINYNIQYIVRYISKFLILYYILNYTKTEFTIKGLFFGLIYIALYDKIYGFTNIYKLNSNILIFSLFSSIFCAILLDHLNKTLRY